MYPSWSLQTPATIVNVRYWAVISPVTYELPRGTTALPFRADALPLLGTRQIRSSPSAHGRSATSPTRLRARTFGKPCGRRRCPYCGERLRRSYIAHFTEAFRDLPQLYATTLTLDPKALPDDLRYCADAQLSALVDQVWRRFRDGLRKDCTKGDVELNYVGAHERHGKGLPHIHALISFPHPEGAEALASRWFRHGGGAVLAIEPLWGGEWGIARWLGYVFKQQFGRRASRGHRLLVNQGIGYHTAQAVARRRAFVEDPDRHMYEPPEVLLPREASSWGRRAFPVGAIELQLDRRTVHYVSFLEGTPFGVEVQVEEGGMRRYQVVEAVWDERRQQRRYEVLSAHESRAEADAAAEAYISQLSNANSPSGS